MEKSYVESFYAVTGSSIFLVKDKDENGHSYIELVVSKDTTTKMSVGQRLKCGDESRSIVVIFYELSMTTEKTYAFLKSTCNTKYTADRMRIKYMGGHSGNIVALFKTKKEAKECFAKLNLQYCDKRWIKETKQVLADIGPNHPDFKIATDDYRLIQDE